MRIDTVGYSCVCDTGAFRSIQGVCDWLHRLSVVYIIFVLLLYSIPA